MPSHLGGATPLAPRSRLNDLITLQNRWSGAGRTVALPLSGAYAPSLHVAGRGLMGHLAAQTVAGCRWSGLTLADVGSVWLLLELEDLISLRVEPARVRQALPLMKRRRPCPSYGRSCPACSRGSSRRFSVRYRRRSSTHHGPGVALGCLLADAVRRRLRRRICRAIYAASTTASAISR